MEWRHRVIGSEAGDRLDRFVQHAFPDVTRSQIKRMVERGLVLVEGRPVKAGHLLRVGENLVVTFPETAPPELEPESIPLEVVYEDEYLLVVDKPAGMVVHPGAGRSRGTLVNALRGRGTPLSPLGAPFRPGVVHRLDKGTSGLLVVAKTEGAHLRLSEALAAREFTRRYLALIWGSPRPPRGRIEGALGRSRADRRRMRVVTRGGKQAATRYRVIAEGRGVSAVELVLETGRTHQIRAHFKHLGHPVFGDPEYGGRRRRVSGLDRTYRDGAEAGLRAILRQALHAAHLGFIHPRTGKALEFISVLPEDMRVAAEALGIPPGSVALSPKEEHSG